MTSKKIDDLENSIYVFLSIIPCHNRIEYKGKIEDLKIWTREWLLKQSERGAYNGILNDLRLNEF